jgi:hypothetical protein
MLLSLKVAIKVMFGVVRSYSLIVIKLSKLVETYPLVPSSLIIAPSIVSVYVKP